VDAYADDGSTPLANAVQTNNVEAVRLLLHEGANVDLPLRHRNGETTTPLSNSRACDG
jgi:ankyrin repeat protein